MRRSLFGLIIIVMLFVFASASPMAVMKETPDEKLAPGGEDGEGEGGGAASVTLISPSGGEDYEAGEDVSITFSNYELSGDIILELTTDGSTFTTIATKSIQPSTSSWHDWIVPNTPTTNAQIRISSTDDPSISDISESFTIRGTEVEDTTVTLVSPTGGEKYTVGEEVRILFSNNGISGDIVLTLIIESPPSLFQITTKSVQPHTSSWFYWIVPNNPTTTAKIAISSATDTSITDSSDYFTIALAQEEETSPEVIPCSPIGWWQNNTTYNALQTVLYPPPTATAWVSLINNNTDTPSLSGNGHDSWVVCEYRDIVEKKPLKLIWNQSNESWEGDFELSNPNGDNFTINGTEELVAFETSDSKRIVLVRDSMHQGAMNSIRNIRAGIWIQDGNGDLDLELLESSPGLHDSVHCIVGGTMCSVFDGTFEDDATEWGSAANLLPLVILDTTPPIVASDCDEGALDPAGVQIESLAMEDVGGHLMVEHTGIRTDVGGHLMVESTGIRTGDPEENPESISEGARSSNDPVFFSHGAQCGAQTTGTIELAEGVTVEDFFRNYLEHGPGVMADGSIDNSEFFSRGLHNTGLPNYIDHGDGTLTIIHSYPGITCDAFTNLHSDFNPGISGRATAIEYGLIASLIATCDDTVVEPLTKSTPDDGMDNGRLCTENELKSGLNDDGVDDDCDGIIEDKDTISSEVMLETGIVDISERDAVVAGTVGGTTFTLSAIYAHWRSARASRL